MLPNTIFERILLCATKITYDNFDVRCFCRVFVKTKYHDNNIINAKYRRQYPINN